MGLRNHLADYLTADGGQDGKMTAYALAKKSGIALNTSYKLAKQPDAPMSWDVLAKLCATLGVQPGELLSVEPD